MQHQIESAHPTLSSLYLHLYRPQVGRPQQYQYPRPQQYPLPQRYLQKRCSHQQTPPHQSIQQEQPYVDIHIANWDWLHIIK
ncbi:hypothetical protein D3C86_1514810 [compost metagenome]